MCRTVVLYVLVLYCTVHHTVQYELQYYWLILYFRRIALIPKWTVDLRRASPVAFRRELESPISKRELEALGNTVIIQYSAAPQYSTVQYSCTTYVVLHYVHYITAIALYSWTKVCVLFADH